MINFIDFFPRRISEGGMFSTARYESIESLMSEVSAWIENEGVELINIETLLLPNLDLDGFDSKAARLVTTKNLQRQ